MSGAIDGVAKSYNKWLRKAQLEESLCRAYELPDIHIPPDRDPLHPEHGGMPTELEVRFLPLAVMLEPDATKQLLSLEAKQDPEMKRFWDVMGLSAESDDRVTGIIIASDKEGVGPKVWYKCGFYKLYVIWIFYPIARSRERRDDDRKVINLPAICRISMPSNKSAVLTTLSILHFPGKKISSSECSLKKGSRPA